MCSHPGPGCHIRYGQCFCIMQWKGMLHWCLQSSQIPQGYAQVHTIPHWCMCMHMPACAQAGLGILRTKLIHGLRAGWLVAVY